MKHWPPSIASFAQLTTGVFAANLGMVAQAQAQAGTRVFELRTYTAHEGKLDAVVARFRDHTTQLFDKHGLTNIGYWVPREQPHTLVYLIAHASRDAATGNWDAFRKDPDWIAVRAASEANGPLVATVQSVYMDPTNFSGIK